MTGPAISRRRFGQAVGALTIAFGLAPASWAQAAKLPGSLDKNRMLDKQVYRNLQQVTPADLQQVADRYALVADLTSKLHVS